MESVDVKFPADVGDAISAQNIEGDAPEPGEMTGLDPNAAGILEQRDVPDVMDAVLNRPMLPGCRMAAPAAAAFRTKWQA